MKTKSIGQDRRTRTGRRLFCLGLLSLLFWTLLPVRAFADPETVRVGYYENEVFEEGAEEGAVKTGYAYEYYRKLSEYTGWKYRDAPRLDELRQRGGRSREGSAGERG